MGRQYSLKLFLMPKVQRYLGNWNCICVYRYMCISHQCELWERMALSSIALNSSLPLNNLLVMNSLFPRLDPENWHLLGSCRYSHTVRFWPLDTLMRQRFRSKGCEETVTHEWSVFKLAQGQRCSDIWEWQRWGFQHPVNCYKNKQPDIISVCLLVGSGSLDFQEFLWVIKYS